MKKIKYTLKKWKVTFFTFLILHVFRHLMYLSLKTCRIKAIGIDTFQKTAREDKCIIMLWHNRIVPILYFFEKFAPRELKYGALISNSRDGELIARLVTSYPQGIAIRVHHQAKHKGLLEMIEHLDVHRTVILITPDGPQGPPYQVKRGVVLAAQATSAKIIPLSWTSSKYWELKTWDKMRIPKPFSSIELRFGTPIQVSKDENEPLEKYAEELKDILFDLDKIYI